jgi:hypothetical protein
MCTSISHLHGHTQILYNPSQLALPTVSEALYKLRARDERTSYSTTAVPPTQNKKYTILLYGPPQPPATTLPGILRFFLVTKRAMSTQRIEEWNLA